MTALVDWRDDANLPARTFGWLGWALAIALLLLTASALTFALLGSAMRVADGACRMREASQGQLAPTGVAVGQPLPPGWSPGPRVKVRYVDGYAQRGVVVDATTCLSSDPTKLTVVVAR